MPGLANTSQAYLIPLLNLNLYSPTNIYDLNNNTLATAAVGVLSSLNSTASEFINGILSNVLLPNTPIQQIANIQLANAIALNAASNLSNNILPSISFNGSNFTLMDAGFWDISSNNPTASFSSLLDTILGFLPPVNPIPYEGPGFDYKASDAYLKANRGEGQMSAYTSNISLNDYSPDNTDNQYVTATNFINTPSNPFSVVSIVNLIKSNDANNPDSVLNITNQIINNNSVLNGTPVGYPSKNELPGDSISPDALAYINPNGTGKTISRGDGTRVSDTSDIFLRVFNYSNTYSGTSSLMKFKHGYAGPNSVLNKTVFPNFSPLSTEASVRNLMFSIENLAYPSGDPSLQKKPYEVGPNGGRAMWFPPYDLTFNESTANDWETIKFIGRGEPIYTYNGSERSMNITFKMIVDYPSQFWNNSWLTASNNDYDKFFRQDNNLNGSVSVGNTTTQTVAQTLNNPVPVTKVANDQTSPYDKSNPLTINFDDGSYALSQSLADDDTNHDGTTNNNNFFSQIGNLISFLNTTKGQNFQVVMNGFSSALNDNQITNTQLSVLRAKAIYDYIIGNGLQNVNNYLFNEATLAAAAKTNYSNNKFSIIGNGSTFATDKNATISTINQDIVDRYATIYLNYNPSLDTSLNSATPDATFKANQITQNTNQQQSITQSNITTENLNFFDRVDDNSMLLFKKYSDGIKYFSPAFHSQTPDDFNTRITFLEQCNRQGSAPKGVQNSIFGLPPVCVLRIGDFYHTKIIITNMSKSFEPLLWDMNPEGIGMQPMMCEINMDIKVIGGQSLAGPLTKLQNALDYNFYANTENNKQNGSLAILQQIADNNSQLSNNTNSGTLNAGSSTPTNSIANNLA